MILYKYRTFSGEAYRYTVDIFRSKRFYLPTASQLNDPNEGVAVIDVQNEWREYANWLSLRDRQRDVRLCAFSASSRNTVLWSHYADEHNGICIELDTNRLKLGSGTLELVNYSKKVPELPHGSISNAEAFLSKSDDWAYEESELGGEHERIQTHGSP
jgi:hypothetical protein